jgi:hypothetical protein
MPRSLDEALSRCKSKLAAWQVRALFLGANASTNPQHGPQQLLGVICGPERVLGQNLSDANQNLQALMTEWNAICRTDPPRLSELSLPKRPTEAALARFSAQRAAEIDLFVRGIIAGGDQPGDFGSDGVELLHTLAQAAELFGMLAKDTALDVAGRARKLVELTTHVETIIAQLMAIGAQIRLADRQPPTRPRRSKRPTRRR